MKKFILQNLIRENILALNPYSCARDEFKGDDAIFLDANENPYGIWNRYPDPYQSKVKQKLCQFKNVPDDRIFIGNGSDEVIDLAFRIFCNPGIDRALSFPPTYGMYKVSAAINNIEMTEIPLRDDFQIDLPALIPFFDDVHLKIIFICSPNNPTGNLINPNDIEFILDNFNGIVFVDEAYIDFAGSKSLISAIDNYPNLIVSQTFSKSRALASARVGLAYSNPEIIGYYNKVKPPYNVSGPNQQAAFDALVNEEEFLSCKSAILAEKQRLQKELSVIPLIKKVYHSDANFFLVEVDDANKIYSALIDMKIVTRNRNSVIKNCIRMTVGTYDENTVLLEALRSGRVYD
ncbi:MAG: histidinol-phosphate transaminase [Prevotellaceae bacterium]|jgi:histidinol-phosphate aminotransferase|nr:histidinol-phosphate transaminase [Prevotellaceae bacterium]